LTKQYLDGILFMNIVSIYPPCLKTLVKNTHLNVIDTIIVFLYTHLFYY